ncbi:MAG TPA: ankyrin repeat domain-containing protein [Tahibacter sp.]|uniref:ankyrin repeat domain-containing protein n=1 Tax=Tahibacter sp. TaxID=2056211 RepID=UPI002CF220ED|nr:ankyrin repeat domain-containing protein [Tahibacter sp.]HSX60865.1 ankyrin repeat domain-containing protein [Tahibacter sp.]
MRTNIAIALMAFGHFTQAAEPALTLAQSQTYLFDASRAGRTELVLDLVKAGTPIDATDASGYTALILAAYNGKRDTVDALLRAGADPNVGDRRGNTALMGAIFKGEEAIVLRLLDDARTQVDARNRAGQTAAMFAALFGKQSVIDRLAARGADLGAADAAGQTPQKLAQQQGNAALAQHIAELAAKADVAR